MQDRSAGPSTSANLPMRSAWNVQKPFRHGINWQNLFSRNSICHSFEKSNCIIAFSKEIKETKRQHRSKEKVSLNRTDQNQLCAVNEMQCAHGNIEKKDSERKKI
jgi:hypothetical protein